MPWGAVFKVWEAVLGLWDALGNCSGALGRPGTPWEAVFRVWDALGSCSEALGRPGGLFWGSGKLWGGCFSASGTLWEAVLAGEGDGGRPVGEARVIRAPQHIRGWSQACSPGPRPQPPSLDTAPTNWVPFSYQIHHTLFPPPPLPSPTPKTPPWGPEGLPSSTGKHKENRQFRPPNADILEIPPS